MVLEDSESRYSQLQEKHKKELEDVRKAGHDTLAIIVEEYKVPNSGARGPTSNGCGTPVVSVIYLQWVWSTSSGCGLPPVGVVYLQWVWSTSSGCGLPLMGVVHL